MQSMIQKIQPLIQWLQVNPEWALCVTFLIAFIESLPVLGTIIPGSITMTAIGILAGTGIMRIDATLIAATLGAIAGDAGSYLLGYLFRDQIHDMWFFRRNPNWLTYGKSYFEKHGGKSVLIGRFVGPLRSIIPVIAGMMHMNHWRFFLANSISAVLWAILYVLPGVFIGESRLAWLPKQTPQRILLIVSLLILLWLVVATIRYILRKRSQSRYL